MCGRSAARFLKEEETDGWRERGSAVEPLGGGVRGSGSGGRGRRQPGLATGVGVTGGEPAAVGGSSGCRGL